MSDELEPFHDQSRRRAKARLTGWVLFGISLAIYFLFIYLHVIKR